MTGDIVCRAVTKVPPRTGILCHSGTGQVRGDSVGTVVFFPPTTFSLIGTHYDKANSSNAS